MSGLVKKQVIVFCGVVINGNKVLLQQRFNPELPDAHLKWEFPGGKIEIGETPEEATIREVYEETGIKIKILKFIPFVQNSYWNYEWGIQQSICFAYLCEFLSQEKVGKDHRVNEVRWFEIDGIKRLDSLPGTNEIIREVKKLCP